MRAVIDTNVLVSALLSDRGPPSKIVERLLHGEIAACYDDRIMDEYEEVLFRPRLRISFEKASEVLDYIVLSGNHVNPAVSDIHFIDESDKPFFETALECGALLITGNAKHFPAKEWILPPTEFLQRVVEDT